MRAMDDRATTDPNPATSNFHRNTPRLGGWLLLECDSSINQYHPNYHSNFKQSRPNLEAAAVVTILLINLLYRNSLQGPKNQIPKTKNNHKNKI